MPVPPRRKPKSDLTDGMLGGGLGVEDGTLLAQEARRQSLLASSSPSEREILEFIWELANTDDALRGWRVD